MCDGYEKEKKKKNTNIFTKLRCMANCFNLESFPFYISLCFLNYIFQARQTKTKCLVPENVCVCVCTDDAKCSWCWFLIYIFCTTINAPNPFLFFYMGNLNIEHVAWIYLRRITHDAIQIWAPTKRLTEQRLNLILLPIVHNRFSYYGIWRWTLEWV